jgi:hypothetical protein
MQVLQGNEVVISYPGLSQYASIENGRRRRLGTSASGLASFNFAKTVLTKERDGCRGLYLLRELLKKETFEVRDKFYRTHKNKVNV